jgi:2-dehydropantoate 2-reductase
MRIAMVGSGALGCLLAATLQPYNTVVMVGRWPAQLEAIAQRGLTIVAPDGGRRILPVATTSRPETLSGEIDVVLIAVKSTATDQAAHDAAVILGAGGGLAVTLQNGLGNLEQLQAVAGRERSTAAVTAQGATLLAPATVRHAGHGPTSIGLSPDLTPGAADLVQRLCEAFLEAGWACTVSADLDLLVWTKLAVNAAINPLTALLGVPNGALLAEPGLVALMDTAAREVAAVARAQSIPLDGNEAAERARQVARDTAANTSSMLQDMQRGAPTEIDAICGAVVSRAKTTDVAVPVNECLLALVRQQERDRQPHTVASLMARLNAPLLTEPAQ